MTRGAWGVGAGIAILVPAFVLSACARGSDDADLFGDEDAAADGEAGTRRDGGAATDGGKTDAGVDAGPACPYVVVLNEVQSNGASASAEFVEIYNAGECAVPLNGWRILYRSSGNGASAAPLYSFSAADTIPSKGRLLFASDAANLPSRNGTLNAGMAATAGQVGLVDQTNKLVDGVAYGAASGDFLEGSAAPAPPSGGSIARKTDGVDTNNNATDWKTSSPATPGAAN